MSKFNWKNLNKPILALAPMAGITDSSFREICREQGADVVYSEMVSADGLFYGSKKTGELLRFSKKEKPIIIQLFGKKPECFPKAVKIAEKIGADGVDINFGCPARKVVGHGGGVSLIKDLDLCRTIILEVIKNTKLPVSIKVRTSIKVNNKKVTILDFLKEISDLKISAIMIHGRSYEQGFSGEIDYRMIKRVKQKFPGIVLANGGINSPEDAKIMLEKTGADGIGLARGVYGKPWLFNQIRDYLNSEEYKEFGLKQIKKIALKQAKLMKKRKGDHGIVEMRKHLCWYFRGFSGAGRMRKELVRVEALEDIEKVFNTKHHEY